MSEKEKKKRLKLFHSLEMIYVANKLYLFMIIVYRHESFALLL